MYDVGTFLNELIEALTTCVMAGQIVSERDRRRVVGVGARRHVRVIQIACLLI